MTKRIHDKIRTILETTPGLTQRGLASRMGLNPAAVNRMLYGRRNIMAEEIPIIENYLGQRLQVSAEGAPRRGFSDVRQQPLLAASSDMVPVYAYKKNVPRQQAGRVPAHPAAVGSPDAFAFYVPNAVMAPRYFQGEMVYVDPARPPETDRDCFIALKNGEAMIRRFLRDRGGKVRVRQFHPASDKDIPAADITLICAVVGRN